jgi:protein-L-isoaspartate(D-aspartate) O-methyltransferase
MAQINFDRAREDLILELQHQGIRDLAVLEAIGKVPREAFVSSELKPFAYQDSPLPIGYDQTISQPYMVALMISAVELTRDQRVLEVGTGSGYAAAVLSHIAKEVVTIERCAKLAARAEKNLSQLAIQNVTVLHRDGCVGCSERAPFDAVIVAAASAEIPDELIAQLAIDGRLVIPIHVDDNHQNLLSLLKTGPNKIEEKNLGGVQFVPLLRGTI